MAERYKKVFLDYRIPKFYRPTDNGFNVMGDFRFVPSRTIYRVIENLNIQTRPVTPIPYPNEESVANPDRLAPFREFVNKGEEDDGHHRSIN